MLRYSHRQEIETMFGCLKTREFNFENTHISRPERLNNLIAVMVIAFVWSYRTGDLFKEVEPIKIKPHGLAIKQKAFLGMAMIICAA